MFATDTLSDVCFLVANFFVAVFFLGAFFATVFFAAVFFVAAFFTTFLAAFFLLVPTLLHVRPISTDIDHVLDDAVKAGVIGNDMKLDVFPRNLVSGSHVKGKVKIEVVITRRFHPDEIQVAE